MGYKSRSQQTREVSQITRHNPETGRQAVTAYTPTVNTQGIPAERFHPRRRTVK